MSSYLAELIATYGYALVALIVGLESMGLPVPGETTLVTAAIYAATTHRLSIAFIIVAAIIGAIAGDSAGYAIGRRFGYRLLLRYGDRLRMNAARIKLGQFLFDRHGGKVVFFGRFIAVLRTLAAVLAGANVMPWPRFLFFNVAGGVVWATAYGTAAYVLGGQIERLRGPLGVFPLIAGAIAVAGFLWFVRRHEGMLEAEAERALPGPLRDPDRRSAG